jgi:transposase
LGVEDWSFLKGRTLGTLLGDLERQPPVDLLPDRAGPTLTAWLLAHPGVELGSRDRRTSYAEAIRLGAPAARQGADRWHVRKTLGEVVEPFLCNKKAALKAAWERRPAPPSASLPAPPARTSRTRQAGATSLARQTRLIDRYHQMQVLTATQVRVTASADQVPLCRLRV